MREPNVPAHWLDSAVRRGGVAPSAALVRSRGSNDGARDRRARRPQKTDYTRRKSKADSLLSTLCFGGWACATTMTARAEGWNCANAQQAILY